MTRDRSGRWVAVSGGGMGGTGRWDAVPAGRRGWHSSPSRSDQPANARSAPFRLGFAAGVDARARARRATAARPRTTSRMHLDRFEPAWGGRGRPSGPIERDDVNQSRDRGAAGERAGEKVQRARTATPVVAPVVAAVAAAVTARGAVSQMRGHVGGLAPAMARGREGRQPRVSGGRSDVAVAVNNSVWRTPPPDDVRSGNARGRVVRRREIVAERARTPRKRRHHRCCHHRRRRRPRPSGGGGRRRRPPSFRTSWS